MPKDITTAWANKVETVHTDDNIKTGRNVELVPSTSNHLDIIIRLFPALPEPYQRVIRANVEALAALAT